MCIRDRYSPQAGTTAIDIQPVFQWNVIEGAESYELLVATDSNFTSTVIARTGELALPANAWRSEVSLEYDTTYYWKVRALGASTHSVWSPVSAFTTEPPPAEPPAEEMAPPSPPPLSSSSSSLPPPSSTSSQTIPDWAIYTAGALLLTTMILSIVTLVLVVSMRQGQH